MNKLFYKTRGKQTCRILKDIRRQIAEANDIKYITLECRYKGDCRGTCPKCEAEVRYLEQQLRNRQLSGKLVRLAGISAGAIAMMMPMTTEARPTEPTPAVVESSISQGSAIIKGIVTGNPFIDSIPAEYEPIIGAAVWNKTNGQKTVTDDDGRFEIPARKGDEIYFSFIGYGNLKKKIVDINEALDVKMELQFELLGEIDLDKCSLSLKVIDEDGNRIPNEKLKVQFIPDKEDDASEKSLFVKRIDDEHPSEILLGYYIYEGYLVNKTTRIVIKEFTLRITAEGYDDPVYLRVKLPKGLNKRIRKTVKFTNTKK